MQGTITLQFSLNTHVTQNKHPRGGGISEWFLPRKHEVLQGRTYE